MRVEVHRTPDVKSIYLEHLKTFPGMKKRLNCQREKCIKRLFSDDSCKAKTEGELATFDLDLKDIYRCMVTRVENKGTVRQANIFKTSTIYRHQCCQLAFFNARFHEFGIFEMGLALKN